MEFNRIFRFSSPIIHWLLCVKTISFLFFSFFQSNLFKIFSDFLSMMLLFIVIKSIVCLENVHCLQSMNDFTQFSTFLMSVILFTVSRPLFDCEWTHHTHACDCKYVCTYAHTTTHCATFWKRIRKGWGVHHMHICIQINDENNDLIKVFMTFRCDDEMKNCKIIEWKKAARVFVRMCTTHCETQYRRKRESEWEERACHRTVVRCLSFKSDYLGWTIKSFTWACVYKLDGWNTHTYRTCTFWIQYSTHIHIHTDAVASICVPPCIVFIHSCTSMWEIHNSMQTKCHQIFTRVDVPFFPLFFGDHRHTQWKSARERKRATVSYHT